MHTIRYYPYEAGRTLYPIDFELGILSRDHVYVYVGDDSSQQVSYTWISDTQISLTSPIQPDEELKIQRIVPQTLFNNYVDGARLSHENLNDSYLQSLMLYQEVLDGFLGEEFRLQSNLVVNNLEVLESGVFRGNLDMDGNSVKNLSYPIDDNDAVSRAFVDEALTNFGDNGAGFAALAMPGSTVPVVGMQANKISFKVGSISELIALPEPYDGLTVDVESYYGDGSGLGHGSFVYSESEDKQNHNGVDVFDPDNVLTIGGAAWYLPQNVGTGCWKRKGVGTKVTASMAGFLPGTARHSIIRNIWTPSNLSKWTKFTVDVKGTYEFTKSNGDSRVHTMVAVEDFIIELNLGVTFYVEAIITSFFNDGFRFDGATNVHWRGKGTFITNYTGNPVTRKEAANIFFNGNCHNCSVSELTMGQFYDPLAVPAQYSVFGVRFSGTGGGSNCHTSGITWLEGSRGKLNQFGNIEGYSCTNHNVLGIGGLANAVGVDRVCRVLGASKNGVIAFNRVMVSADVNDMEVFEFTSGADASPTNYVSHAEVFGNVVLMQTRDDDSSAKVVGFIDIIGAKHIHAHGNYFWTPNNKSGVSDVFRFVSLIPINSVMPTDLKIVNNIAQCRVAFRVSASIPAGNYNWNVRNEFLTEWPGSASIDNPNLVTFNNNGQGLVSFSNGVSTSAADVEITNDGTTTSYKYADGRLIQERLASSQSCNSAAGTLFRSSAVQTWTFPIPFVGDIPAVNYTVDNTDRWGTYITTLSSVQYRQVSHTSSAGTSGGKLIAEGRWRL